MQHIAEKYLGVTGPTEFSGWLHMRVAIYTMPFLTPAPSPHKQKGLGMRLFKLLLRDVAYPQSADAIILAEQSVQLLWNLTQYFNFVVDVKWSVCLFEVIHVIW